MFYMDRGAKVSTVTPHTDLLLRGQRSKRSNYNKKIVQDYSFKHGQMQVLTSEHRSLVYIAFWGKRDQGIIFQQ